MGRPPSLFGCLIEKASPEDANSSHTKNRSLLQCNYIILNTVWVSLGYANCQYCRCSFPDCSSIRLFVVTDAAAELYAAAFKDAHRAAKYGVYDRTQS